MIQITTSESNIYRGGKDIRGLCINISGDMYACIMLTFEEAQDLAQRIFSVAKEEQEKKELAREQAKTASFEALVARLERAAETLKTIPVVVKETT